MLSDTDCSKLIHLAQLSDKYPTINIYNSQGEMRKGAWFREEMLFGPSETFFKDYAVWVGKSSPTPSTPSKRMERLQLMMEWYSTKHHTPTFLIKTRSQFVEARFLCMKDLISGIKF